MAVTDRTVRISIVYPIGIVVTAEIFGRMYAMHAHTQSWGRAGAGALRSPARGGRGFDGVRASGVRGRACRTRLWRRVLGRYRRGQARRHTSIRHRRRVEGRRTSTGARSVRISTANRRGRAGGCASVTEGNATRKRAQSRHGRTGAYRCARSSGPPPNQDDENDGENDTDGMGPCGHGFALPDIAGD